MLSNVRGLAVVFLGLAAVGCGGEADRGRARPVGMDAGPAIDGDAACGAGEQLCDVCGTLGCYSGACPIHSCLAQATCPADLPEPGTSCGIDGARCGYATSTNPCGADSCYCQAGAWNCEPTCVFDAGGDGCPPGEMLLGVAGCGTVTLLIDAGTDESADAACPEGEMLCPTYCVNPADDVCIADSDSGCPGPPFDCPPPR
jgi:hypothetical protein